MTAFSQIIQLKCGTKHNFLCLIQIGTATQVRVTVPIYINTRKLNVFYPTLLCIRISIRFDIFLRQVKL